MEKMPPPPSLPQGGDDQNFSNQNYRFLYFRSKHLKGPTQKISGLYLVYKTMRQYDRKSYIYLISILYIQLCFSHFTYLSNFSENI